MHESGVGPAKSDFTRINTYTSHISPLKLLLDIARAVAHLRDVEAVACHLPELLRRAAIPGKPGNVSPSKSAGFNTASINTARRTAWLAPRDAARCNVYHCDDKDQSSLSRAVNAMSLESGEADFSQSDKPSGCTRSMSPSIVRKISAQYLATTSMRLHLVHVDVDCISELRIDAADCGELQSKRLDDKTD